MTDEQKLALYEQLESWAEGLAVNVARKFHLLRWRDDLMQEARLALWQAIERYDSSRRVDVEAAVKSLAIANMRNALKRYRRWNEREVQFPDHLEM